MCTVHLQCDIMLSAGIVYLPFKTTVAAIKRSDSWSVNYVLCIGLVTTTMEEGREGARTTRKTAE